MQRRFDGKTFMVTGAGTEVVLSGTPAGKIPKPEEMTGAALFLASEDAHHVTGWYMIADGGYSMLGA